MCLRLLNDKTEKKIAQENIPVLKVMRRSPISGKLISFYQAAEYELNELVTSKLDEPRSMYDPNLNFCVLGYGESFDGINKGLHSFADDWYGGDSYKPFTPIIVVCKGYIPAGAEYYEGVFDVRITRTKEMHTWKSYASTQLILTEILEKRDVSINLEV